MGKENKITYLQSYQQANLADGASALKSEDVYKPREILGSKAFNLEYGEGFTDSELRADIISYLGEYRFKIQKYNYELEFSGDSLTGFKLRDTHRGEALGVKAERAVEEKKLRGENSAREEAELLGIKHLEDQLRFTKSGTTLVWMSPPGPREDGYGDYGFVYVGEVDKSSSLKTSLSMTAIRVESPTINQFNNTLSDLIEEDINYSEAEDFLQSPFVLKGKGKEDIENTLKKHFSFKVDSREREVFDKAIANLNPAINQFVDFVKHGNKEEKLKAFYAIENYALELKDRYLNKEKANEKIVYLDEYRKYDNKDDFQGFIYLYGNKKPPVVSGSCGSTGSVKSNDVFGNGYQALMKTVFGEENNDKFECPRCKQKADGPVGNQCPNCGLTKEEYAESGGEVC
ncbi:MAG: hypothetical protein M1450_01000 [Patescibacteria group bacterium]|nr:hypothetical protein [Patescibacteria group bacterium]